jgi:subtilase family serine protease
VELSGDGGVFDMRAAKSRNFLFGLALAGLVSLLVASAALSSSGASSDGPPFIALGSVSALGKNKQLCASGTVCYTPAQLQAAYDWPTGRRAPDGSGQTIVVVVAYGNPGVETDLQQFDQLFDVPPTHLSYCGQNGVNPDDPDAPGWAVETSADVEYAHALAPGARIVLAIAPTDNLSDLAATEVQCVPRYPGAIVSQSFGEDETDAATDPTVQAAILTLHHLFVAATNNWGDTFVAGAGDGGATDGNDTAVAAYPASDPLVTAVGGTEGLPYPGGLLRGNGNRYGAEQVWNEGDFIDAATGGAPSMIFPRPTYQNGFTNSSTRTVADVSWNAAVNGGELVVFSGQVGNFGGTSAGPPPWAALFALADEERAQNHQDSLGQANPELYAIAAGRRNYNQDFNDVTQGSNALDSDIGYTAGPGYDLPTGLGTPDVSNLLNDLVGGPSNHRGDGDGDPGRPGHGGNGHGGRHRAWAGG